MRVRFDDFVLDGEVRQLARNGEALSLSPKAFQLLQTLIEERPRALSKRELMDRLWPDVFVEEENLKSRISEIRAALGDTERRYVRTVQRFGYAFAGAVQEETATAVLSGKRVARLVHDLQAFVLEQGTNLIGRGADCEIQIDETGVSRRHAEIFLGSDVITLRDLGSKNGTFVNTRKISGATPIHDADKIQIGPVTLTLRAAADPLTTDTFDPG